MIRFGNIGGSAAMGGGGGAVGGGNNTYVNPTDFTATITNATKTITIAGLSFTLEDKHVINGSIKKISSAGVVSKVPLTTVTVASDVITLADADDFVTGDEVVVTITGPDKGYDKGIDANRSSIDNPDYAHNTTPEPLISETNLGLDGVHDGAVSGTVFNDTGETYTPADVAEGYDIYNVTDVSSGEINIGGAGNPSADDISHAALAGGGSDDWQNGEVASIPQVKRFVIPATDYTLLTLHSKITAGVANIVFLKIYATLFDTADDQSDDDWVNISLGFLGNADGITATAGNTTQDISSSPVPIGVLKYMVKIIGVAIDGVQANAFDVKAKKASS